GEAELDDFTHRERKRQGRRLRKYGAQRRHFPELRRLDLALGEQDRARITEFPRHRLQKRRLAGPVRTDDGRDLAGKRREADIGYDALAANVDANIVEF